MKKPNNQICVYLRYALDLLFHIFWGSSHPSKEEDVTDKIVIVTGSNTGIGKETALQLAKRGAKVIMACRNREKAEGARNHILEKVPNANLEIMELDLTSLSSIRSFVQAFESIYDKLHILVNNAGAMNTQNKRVETTDGFEFHIGVNHLGPFLLTKMLLPMLKKGASSRIVCVSSTHSLLSSSTDLVNDLMMEKSYTLGIDGYIPYNNSKLLNTICIIRLAQEEIKEEDSIKVFQLCPGLVKTDLFWNDVRFGNCIRKMGIAVGGLTPEQGCRTVVYCAVDKDLISSSTAGKGEMYRFSKLWDNANDFLKVKDEEEREHLELLYKKSSDLVHSSSTGFAKKFA